MKIILHKVGARDNSTHTIMHATLWRWRHHIFIYKDHVTIGNPYHPIMAHCSVRFRDCTLRDTDLWPCFSYPLANARVQATPFDIKWFISTAAVPISNHRLSAINDLKQIFKKLRDVTWLLIIWLCFHKKYLNKHNIESQIRKYYIYTVYIYI